MGNERGRSKGHRQGLEPVKTASITKTSICGLCFTPVLSQHPIKHTFNFKNLMFLLSIAGFGEVQYTVLGQATSPSQTNTKTQDNNHSHSHLRAISGNFGL